MDVVRIQIETNADDASKTFEKLANAFDNSDKQASDLRKQIKGLKDELYQLTPGTEEYMNVIQELGGKMDQLSDTTQELKVASGGLDQVFQSTTNATATMASGFSAVTGIMALFGADTDDLQKTFVKLQAVMAIMTGLKGFAGFGKATKQASISLKAYIAQSALATKATAGQATATAGLAVAEGTATVATGGLSAAFTALTAAIAANPIGAILVAVTAAAAAISHFITKSREAAEQAESTDRSLKIIDDRYKSISEVISDSNKAFEEERSRMQKLGASYDQLADAERKYIEQQQEYIQGRKELLKAKIDSIKTDTKQKDTVDELMAVYAELTDEYDKNLKKLKELDNEADRFSRETSQKMVDAQQRMKVAMAGGWANEGTELREYIRITKESMKELEETVSKGRSRVYKIQMTPEEREAAMYGLQQDLKKYETDLNAFYAKNSKASKDAFKGYSEDIEDMRKKIASLVTSLKTEHDAVASVTGVEGSRETELFTNRVNEANAEITKLYEKIKKDSKLSTADLKVLQEAVKNLREELKFDTGLTDSLEVMTQSVKLEGLAKEFEDEMAAVKKAIADGRLSQEEYFEWLPGRLKKYGDDLEAVSGMNAEIIEKALEGVDPAKREEVKKQWEDLLSFSGQLSPDTVSQVTSTIDNIYSEAVAEITAQTEHAKAEIENATGGGVISSIMGLDVNIVETRMREQMNSLMAIAEQEYMSKKEQLENAMKSLEDSGLTDTSQYEEYEKELTAISDKYNALRKQAAEDTAASIKNEISGTLQNVGTFANSLSSFGSAMADYYTDMAENEAKNEKEKKKYTIKGLQMQKFTAVANIASGIAGAIAGAMQLGFPMGPIVAALESAAVAAAGAVQIKQINRQIKEAGGSAGGNDTPDAAGMVDRIITGETQNADQREQLNAQYTGESVGEQKVYVTQNDITDAQDVNRTAVTQNTF